MQKRLLFNSKQLETTLRRLCQQLIENHGDFSESVLIGLQPRGVFLAKRIQKELTSIIDKEIPLGFLDTTFHRDDFRRRDSPLTANETHIPFLVENMKVILIDDVLFTGRSVRAALDAMTSFGRPHLVELLILVDRMYSREIPVEANYVGKRVNTITSQKILVELYDQGHQDDNIWIMDKAKDK